MVRHLVVEVVAAGEAEAVQNQCHSVGVHAGAIQAEGEVFQAAAAAGQVRPADQREEAVAVAEVVQVVQLK